MSGRSAAFKVARKNAIRNRKRTIFLVLLVAVPVAFGVVVAGVVRASSLTREEQAQTFFGASDVRIDLFSLDNEAVDWITRNIASLDSESTITEFHQFGISVPGAGYALVSDLNLRDPAAAGYLISLAGRTPTGSFEVAISPSLAEELEVKIGDSVEFDSLPFGALEVVGLVSQPFNSTSSDILVEPGGLEPLLNDPTNPAGLILFVSGPNAEEAGTRLEELWYNEGQELFWPEPAVDPIPPELAFIAQDPELIRLLTEDEINKLVKMMQSFDETEPDPQGMIWNAAWQMIYGGGLHTVGFPIFRCRLGLSGSAGPVLRKHPGLSPQPPPHCSWWKWPLLPVLPLPLVRAAACVRSA